MTVVCLEEVLRRLSRKHGNAVVRVEGTNNPTVFRVTFTEKSGENISHWHTFYQYRKGRLVSVGSYSKWW